MPVPTPTAITPTATPTPAQRTATQLTVPIGLAQVGNVVSENGRNFLILEVMPGAVMASPGGGGSQQVVAIEVLPTDTQESFTRVLGAYATATGTPAPSTGAASTPSGGGGRAAGRPGVLELQRQAFQSAATGKTGASNSANPRNLSYDQAIALCKQGDLDACTIAAQISVGLPPNQTGGGGLSFDQQAALARIQNEPSIANIRQQAQTTAESAAERINTGLASALQAIGMSAPETFLAQTDPQALRDALVQVLGSGRGVYPTIERQNLVAQAAQSPTDVVRLLFLSGGQTPPAQRTGAFNMSSVLEEGTRAREDLARQIAAIPVPSLQELVARFTPPLPGAAKGAIIEMRRGKDGAYTASGGATIAHGPELFTVGEKGMEFALLAPGSVVAPMIKGEAPTKENARKAVVDMLVHGKRQLPKARAGKAQGGLISEGDLGLQSLYSVLTGAEATGAALQDTGRGTTGRIRDLRLQLFPFPDVTPEARATILAQSAQNPNLRDILNIGLTDRARNPLPYAEQDITQARMDARSQVIAAMQKFFAGLGVKFEDLPPAQQENLINKQLGVYAPELSASDKGSALSLLDKYGTGETLRGIEESLREGGGAPGTQFPFAKLASLPAGARAAAMTVLGSLFGSDIVSNLQDLFNQGRANAFAASDSRLLI